MVGRYVFGEPVEPAAVQQCICWFDEWTRDHPGEPVELWLNTPGGGVLAGLALCDYLRWLALEGHHVTTAALGMAASIGAVILQAGQWRVVGRDSFVLLHPVEVLAANGESEVDGELEIAGLAAGRIREILVERTDLSGRQLDEDIMDDWWFDSAAALAAGLVDEIR